MSLTRDLPIRSVGFPPTNAVHPPASQHGVFIPFAPLKLARLPLSLAATLAALPSISESPFPRFKRCNGKRTNESRGRSWRASIVALVQAIGTSVRQPVGLSTALVSPRRVDGRRPRLQENAIAVIRDAIRDSRIAHSPTNSCGCASPEGLFRLQFAQGRVAQLDLAPILAAFASRSVISTPPRFARDCSAHARLVISAETLRLRTSDAEHDEGASRKPSLHAIRESRIASSPLDKMIDSTASRILALRAARLSHRVPALRFLCFSSLRHWACPLRCPGRWFGTGRPCF